jgi:hypothetical protein
LECGGGEEKFAICVTCYSNSFVRQKLYEKTLNHHSYESYCIKSSFEDRSLEEIELDSRRGVNDNEPIKFAKL